MRVAPAKLKKVLNNVLDAAVFDAALAESKKNGADLCDTLVNSGKVPDYYLVEVLSSYFRLPIVDLRQVAIPTEVLNLIPENYAKANRVVAFALDKAKRILDAALADPFDYAVINYLQIKTGYRVRPHLSKAESLSYGLRRYHELNVSFDEVIAGSLAESIEMGRISAGRKLSELSSAVSIVNILNTIINYAVERAASDIHFEPLAGEMLVRFRVDGVLSEVVTLSKEVEPILVARVKILSGLQIDEHRQPQDGRFGFELDDGQSVDVRVNVMPVLHGEKVEMRLLRSQLRPLSLNDLGLSSGGVELVRQAAARTSGMILATGPTGHGKTTTLYALLHLLNQPEVNITTIEDPIEYEISRVNQTQVNQKAGITFANGLRSILRQNPDIIMVGEIRDSETMEIAIRSALTGHLVLSSLHTNDAPSTIPRLLDMKAPAFLLASTINLIIAQRLVRQICTFCRGSKELSPDDSRLIEEQLAMSSERRLELPKTVYRGAGCAVCGGSGYQGQTGIFELLPMTENVRKLLLRSASAREIRDEAIKEGMVTMFENGLEKVKQGVTTVEEVLRVIRE